MPALTPSYLTDLETRMRLISARSYDVLAQDLWCFKVAKQLQSESKKERLIWLLDSAKIERTNVEGGQIPFEDILSATTEFTNQNAAAGLEMSRNEIEDKDANGVESAAHWARTIGAYAAYWPQEQIAKAMLLNPTCYTGQPLFSTAHPVNPFNSSLGTFANRFTGASSGAYPGAAPIDYSVSVDEAVQNLSKVLAYIATIKQPGGTAPRKLKPVGLLHPPNLTARAQQITNARFIAQAAGSAAGSADVEAIIRNYGLGQPIEAPELGSAFTNGSDTTYYLLMKEIISDELGALIYSNRNPFKITYHDGMTDAQLERENKLQWTCQGRNIVAPGHPYLIMRCDAA